MHSQYGGKDLLPLQLCGHMLKPLSVMHRLSLEETSPVAFDLKQLSMQHTLRTCELDKKIRWCRILSFRTSESKDA